MCLIKNRFLQVGFMLACMICIIGVMATAIYYVNAPGSSCLVVKTGSPWFLQAPEVLNAYILYPRDDNEEKFNDAADERVAYLTFDDGPSENTPVVLDILEEYEAVATFFVNGVDIPFGHKMYRRMVKEGHALGNHTYSHKYSQIYQSTESFFEDLLQLELLLKKVIGKTPRVMRFPGGSTNTVSRSVSGYNIMEELIVKVEKAGYIYHDWNVCAFDSDFPPPNEATITQNVLQQARFREGDIVVLLHDGMMNKTTPGALPKIIEGLREMGFHFEVITPEVERVQFY